MSDSKKRDRKTADLDDTPLALNHVSKRCRTVRPRLHFRNTMSKSAKYSYHPTFQTQKKNSLAFPDEVVEIVLSYCHIKDIYLIRNDEYFRRITDVKINRNPNYLYDIFIASTNIKDMSMLIKYDTWFRPQAPRSHCHDKTNPIR